MTISGLNWWIVLIGSIFTFISGGIWFAPKTFYKPWAKALNKKHTGNQKYPPLQLFGFTFLEVVVQVTVLGWLINSLQHHIAGVGILDGAIIGFWVGLGFATTTSLKHVLFAEHNIKVWLLENANDLINFAVVGALFATFN